MKGMDGQTGKHLDGLQHLRQSVRDILTTRIGTRVMRRDYGSRLPELVDRPINRAGLVEIYAATAQALRKWEPRLSLRRVQVVTTGSDGAVELILEGVYRPDGQKIKLDGVAV